MKLKDYPTDLTEREVELGFRVIEIEKPNHRTPYGEFYEVAALVLSETDILVKIPRLFGKGYWYSHRRWGCFSYEQNDSWHPIGDPHENAEIAIHECSLGFKDPTGRFNVVGKPFRQK
jgi:hypothetical protein